MRSDLIPGYWNYRGFYLFFSSSLLKTNVYNCHVLLVKLKSLTNKIGMTMVWSVILEIEETILYLYFLCLRKNFKKYPFNKGQSKNK